MNVMMQLGGFQFSLGTAAYQEFQRSTAYSWAAQQRYGMDDALQPTGPGVDTITLQGVVFPEFKGGTGQVDAMRALADAQRPLVLIDGRGRMLGEWVIEGVDEYGTIFAAAGVARKQQFVVKLRRFQSDGGNAGGLVASALGAIGAALPAAGNLGISGLNVANMAKNGAGGMLAGLSSSLASVTGLAGAIGSQANTVLSAVRGGINAAKTLQNAGSDAGRLLAGINSLAIVPSAMNGLVNAGGNVSRAAGTASSILRAAGVDLTATSADPAAIAAVRDGMIGINRLNMLAGSVRTAAQNIVGAL